MSSNKYILLLIVSVGLYLALPFVANTWFHGVEPTVSAHLAVKTVNGGSAEYVAQRSYEENKSAVESGFGYTRFGCIVLAVYAGFKLVRRRNGSVGQGATALILAGLSLGLTGCGRQPYDVPEFKDVGTNQTAYVIPLADVKKQEKFDSAFLESKKQVASRRIQIPHEWIQTGRQPFYMSYAPGEYKPTVKFIVIDRTPVMREWSSDPQNTGGKKELADGVNVESSDSIGFSLGFKVVAFISEEDASTFLYMNPSGSLATVIDTEILARIQKIAASECAKYPMDICRTKKAEIYKAIDEDVVPFFKPRGITITTIAQLGGIIYDNPKIQEAMDATVIDQQLRVSAIAKAEAQIETNKGIESKATAEANATRSKAQADADTVFYAQKATADGIREVAKATADAQSGAAYIRLKELDVALEWAKHSQGMVPQFVVQGGEGGAHQPANFFMSLPPDFVKTSQTVTQPAVKK